MSAIKLLFISLLSATFSMSAFSKNTSHINKSNIHGLWQCQGSSFNAKTNMTIKGDYKVLFMANGSSTGKGQFFLSVLGIPEIEYRLVDEAKWAIKLDDLFFSSSNFSLKNMSHPEFEQMLNISALMPKKITDSVKILKLTKTQLQVQSKKDNRKFSCVKLS